MAKQEKDAEQEKDTEQQKTKRYIVVHKIKEGRKMFSPGDEYTGKFTDKFLEGRQIRERD